MNILNITELGVLVEVPNSPMRLYAKKCETEKYAQNWDIYENFPNGQTRKMCDLTIFSGSGQPNFTISLTGFLSELETLLNLIVYLNKNK